MANAFLTFRPMLLRNVLLLLLMLMLCSFFFVNHQMQKIDVYEHIIQEFANRSLSERARARVIKNTRDELE